MNLNYKHIGRRIRQERLRNRLSQEKLAEKAGISVPFMTQIELARKTPSLDVIENIAKASIRVNGVR